MELFIGHNEKGKLCTCVSVSESERTNQQSNILYACTAGDLNILHFLSYFCDSKKIYVNYNYDDISFATQQQQNATKITAFFFINKMSKIQLILMMIVFSV